MSVNKNNAKQKIAIIGTGISGMAAAFLLHPHYDITVYEKSTVIGGHSRTINVTLPEGNIAVDTGFIVFNKRNYPLLTGLFEYLNVPIAPSNMSFGASFDNGWLEYGTKSLSALFAQKRNMIRLQYITMLRDIMRFNKMALEYLNAQVNVSLGDCIDELKMGRWFRDYYLLPIGGAIWSTSPQKMLDFPAKTFIRFFHNHGLLTVNDQPQWYTVKGGSVEYVKRLTASFSDHIKTTCGVRKVIRHNNGVKIIDNTGNTLNYDMVVFACHSDQALTMIDQPTDDEHDILGAIKYKPNTVILHSDSTLMPKNRGAWASWAYLENNQKQRTDVSLTYWMNSLQPLDTKTQIFVTINPDKMPKPELIYDNCILSHPQFDMPALLAQQKIPQIQGKDRFWFCGAWQGYGFHEDGLNSAVTLAQSLGCDVPWK